MKRDNSNKVLFGVCSGLANYLGVEPVLVRVIFAFLTLVGFGSPILIYILLALLMPSD
jgi:phage shock protein PspC (stress-responsive transcriptional regulator)